MERSTRRRRRRSKHPRQEWVQLAALFLTAITAIAGCVEHFL
jgi:hypothetical protein